MCDKKWRCTLVFLKKRDFFLTPVMALFLCTYVCVINVYAFGEKERIRKRKHRLLILTLSV